MDRRIEELAGNLVRYSCRVMPGEKVLIEYIGHATGDLARQLVKEVYAAGGLPFLQHTDPRLQREQMLLAPQELYELQAKWDSARMRDMDCYIGIRGSDNVSELADVPGSQQSLYQKSYSKPVHTDIRVPSTKWVVLRYPNDSMAQLNNTSLESFEDFYFKVCNLDYSRMSQAMDPLVSLMERTDRVRITSPGTDLHFSIKGIPAIKCDGRMNIPDGEVFTAPVRDSVNGHITFNTPAVYQGFTYENIRLELKDGRIVDAIANDTKRILEVFDTDEGARYIGEFAIGVNPYILKPMKNTLFDEKIMGSFHFTPGNAYEEADNTNRSAVHWDLVLIQTPAYGGGEIHFDDVLVRKDGRFVLPGLEGLNPENLV
ncbi:aminopeptidase [Anaerotalea alkaliphila]|uniref:Aminopeptidase n=1 Tax=Anaerotalea alkaliphila TaxID=2662126 RepID=A0A7X5HU63_9FIRM|nr:aminopeptidase [Anaerotalea alkaliphila]NDL66727.1 aminopeptidase [Anaerotalea alkaliphila]